MAGELKDVPKEFQVSPASSLTMLVVPCPAIPRLQLYRSFVQRLGYNDPTRPKETTCGLWGVPPSGAMSVHHAKRVISMMPKRLAK